MSILTIGCTPDRTSGQLIGAKFDDTELCYPASHSPDTSFMDALLAPIADQLDSSEGQELIHIPAEKIKELVPDYSLSQVNSFGAEVENTLMGLAYSLSTVGDPDGMAKQAWNSQSKSDNPHFVEADPDLPFIRVYPYSEPFPILDFVMSPPPTEAEGDPPEGWYIGGCMETAGMISCRQTLVFESVYYEYRLGEQNLLLRNDVEVALTELMNEWKLNCRDR